MEILFGILGFFGVLFALWLSPFFMLIAGAIVAILFLAGLLIAAIPIGAIVLIYLVILGALSKISDGIGWCVIKFWRWLWRKEKR